MGAMETMLRMVDRLMEAGLSEDEAIECVSRLLVLAGEVFEDEPSAEAA